MFWVFFPGCGFVVRPPLVLVRQRWCEASYHCPIFSHQSNSKAAFFPCEPASWLAHHGHCTLNFSLMKWQGVFFYGVCVEMTGCLPLMSQLSWPIKTLQRWDTDIEQPRHKVRSYISVWPITLRSPAQLALHCFLLVSNGTMWSAVALLQLWLCSGVEPDSCEASRLWKTLLDRWRLLAVLMCGENSGKFWAHSHRTSDVSKVWR